MDFVSGKNFWRSLEIIVGVDDCVCSLIDVGEEFFASMELILDGVILQS